MIAYVGGDWVEAAEATVPITDRGFLLGDGVYDTCRVFEGAWFRFDEHAARLQASGDILRIEVPSVAMLRTVADGLLDRNRPVDHAVLRFTVTRGSDDAGTATSGAGLLVATLRPLPADWRDRARAGWSVLTAAVRHPPPAVMPPALKGQGRGFSLLARLEAAAAGVDDALLLSLDGHVTEGTSWNVFWRKGQTLRTPSAGAGILAGVTRSLVTVLAAESGYRVEEGLWLRSELDDADEAFATLTSLGLVPLRSLDGREFPGTGPAVESLTAAYWDRVKKEAHG